MSMNLYTYVGPFIQIENSKRVHNFIDSKEMIDIFYSSRYGNNKEDTTFLLPNGKPTKKSVGITTTKYSEEFAKQIDVKEELDNFKESYKEEIEKLKELVGEFNLWIKYGVVTYIM